MMASTAVVGSCTAGFGILNKWTIKVQARRPLTK